MTTGREREVQRWTKFFETYKHKVLVIYGSSTKDTQTEGRSITLLAKDPVLPVWNATRIRGVHEFDFASKAQIDESPAFGYDDSFIMSDLYKEGLPVIIGDTSGIESADICLYIFTIN